MDLVFFLLSGLALVTNEFVVWVENSRVAELWVLWVLYETMFLSVWFPSYWKTCMKGLLSLEIQKDLDWILGKHGAGAYFRVISIPSKPWFIEGFIFDFRAEIFLEGICLESCRNSTYSGFFFCKLVSLILVHSFNNLKIGAATFSTLFEGPY